VDGWTALYPACWNTEDRRYWLDSWIGFRAVMDIVLMRKMCCLNVTWGVVLFGQFLTVRNIEWHNTLFYTYHLIWNFQKYLILLSYRDSYESGMLNCHSTKLIATLDRHTRVRVHTHARTYTPSLSNTPAKLTVATLSHSKLQYTLREIIDTIVPFYKLQYVRSQKTIVLSRKLERKGNETASF
jgi:hypothetical protein